jgi:RND family efflux transporter MFP subunit
LIQFYQRHTFDNKLELTMLRKNVLLLLVMPLLVIACSEQPAQKEIIRTVIAFEPSSSNSVSQRTMAGVLQAVDQSTLSFEIPGVIETVNVNLGESFAQGDVLASIDGKVFELAVQRAQAQFSEARARLTEAKLDVERKRQLLGTGAVSKADVDLAEARYQSLQDQVNIANTQLAIAQEDLSDTVLRAPYSGSVAQRHVEPSQQVAPSSAILTIQGSDALEVSVLMPESMIASVAKGDEVDVSVAINQKQQTIKGRVFEVGKQAQRANAFPVTVSLIDTNISSQIKPGMSAEVNFTIGSNASNDGSLKAPLSAVAAAANNAHFVYEILNEGELATLKRVPVTIVSMHSDHVRFITENELKSIVRVGLDFLEDGQQVRISQNFPKTINQ